MSIDHPEYLAHPAADLFPLVGEEELAELAADIQANGQHESIKLYRGRILDGRNRYRACDLAGVAPTFEELPDDTDPWRYAWSVNGVRRHLTESQRAMIGAQIVAEIQATRDSGAHVRRGEGRAREQAAAMVQVSPRTIDHATRVLASGTPELAEAVKEGDVPVSVAAAAARLPAAEQRKVLQEVEQGETPAVATAKAIERQIGKAKRPPQTTKREPLKDRLGNDVPDRLRDVFGDPWLADVLAQLANGAAELRKASVGWLRIAKGKGPSYRYLRLADFLGHVGDALKALELAAHDLESGQPHAVCPACGGKACDDCRQTGYVPRWRLDEMAAKGHD